MPDARRISLRYLPRPMAAVCLLLTLLTGCKVGPDYKTPAAVTPQGWVSSASHAKTQIEQNWWTRFHDPVLDGLIAKALAGNWDLKIAESRIAGARAARSTAFNDLLPTVNTDANFERQGNRLAFPASPGLDLSKPFDVYQAGFDASWELDLFGGKRRGLESARADLEAVEATRDDARVSLLAEVARTYVDIRQYQTQLAIAQENITADEETAKISRRRFEVGDTPELDATRADAQVKEAKAQLPYYQNLLLQAEFSMDMLLGSNAGTTQKLIVSAEPIPSTDKAPVLAAPAHVIAQRPDIREAERKLASATAQQGVAAAQFFPDISLTGFFGLLNTQAGSFLHTDSKSWDVGGNLIWPILNYGKLSANLAASDARAQEALAEYRKTVLAAMLDVERSFTAYGKEDDHRAALEEAVKDDAKALAISRARYKEGLSSFIDVLDAERTLYTLQSQAAASRAQASKNLVAVYKSLGGGWAQVQPSPPTTKSPTLPGSPKLP